MAVPALLMQQRSRRLDQALPDACRGGVAVTNYRTPDGFQGLVGGPIVAGVEQTARPRQDRLTLCRSHGRQWRQRAATGGSVFIDVPLSPLPPLPPSAVLCRLLPPLAATGSALRGSSRSSPPTPRPPSRSRPQPAPPRRPRAPPPRP